MSQPPPVVAGVPCSRLVLGLVLREPAGPARLGNHLQDEALAALDVVGLDEAVARVAMPIPGSPPETQRTGYDEVLVSGLSNGVLLGGIDAILELAAPANHDAALLTPGFGGLAERLGDLVDADASVAVVGTDFVVLDGDAPIQLFYFMRRNRALTVEQFTETWRDQHTRIARFTPGLAGYRQLHASAALSAEAARAAGVGQCDVDGVALEWFSDFEAFLSATGAAPEFREQAKASESRFNDLERATAVLTRTSTTTRSVDAP
jgi:hypothetical protein